VQMLESKFRVYDMRTQHPAEGFAHLTEKVRRASGKAGVLQADGVRAGARGRRVQSRRW